MMLPHEVRLLYNINPPYEGLYIFALVLSLALLIAAVTIRMARKDQDVIYKFPAPWLMVAGIGLLLTFRAPLFLFPLSLLLFTNMAAEGWVGVGAGALSTALLWWSCYQSWSAVITCRPWR